MIGNANAANLPSTSANSMLNQPVGGMAQQNAGAIGGMGPTQNLAQRQQNQNPSMMMNQGINAGNINALQQMKQNQQQQLAGNNMFAGAAGLAQQRQVRVSSQF